MLEKDLKTAVKSVLGTAASVGILVENKNPNELIQEINEHGVFDKEISQGLTEASKEKKQELDNYFNKIKQEQEAKLAAEKAAAEVAAQAAQPTQTTPSGGAETKIVSEEAIKTQEKKEKTTEKKEK